MEWTWTWGEASFSPEERAILDTLKADLAHHMKSQKPKRFAHSLSVAKTAEQMALAYGISAFEAKAAGILHDWDKVLSPSEQIDRAHELHVDLGVDLELVQPLLHGITAARTLPAMYPELSPRIWQAIERHTIGAADMSELDMVVFVADGVEPIRKDVPAIHRVRQMIEQRRPLTDVFWASFSSGISYVIDTERYLYPGTLDIYNELVLSRSR